MTYILKPEEETAKLFSDKTRLKILELLSKKELTNGGIVKVEIHYSRYSLPDIDIQDIQAESYKGGYRQYGYQSN